MLPEEHTTLVVVLEGAVIEANDTNRLEGKELLRFLSREGVEFSLNAEETLNS